MWASIYFGSNCMALLHNEIASPKFCKVKFSSAWLKNLSAFLFWVDVKGFSCAKAEKLKNRNTMNKLFLNMVAIYSIIVLNEKWAVKEFNNSWQTFEKEKNLQNLKQNLFKGLEQVRFF